jgi:hypothetical protein
MDIQEVKQALQQIGYQNPFSVTFKKVSGELREMRCMMEQPTSEPKNHEVVPVMDLDKGSWRSFRIDSVVAIS